MEGPTDAVGKYADLATLTRASACRNCASATATFWFEMLTCSSSVFNCGSLNTSHHLPRSRWSAGSAFFQPSISLNASGVTARGLTIVGSHRAACQEERKKKHKEACLYFPGP